MSKEFSSYSIKQKQGANLDKAERLEDVKLLLYGILVGAFAGILTSFYRYTIKSIDYLYEVLQPLVQAHALILLPLALLFVSLAAIVAYCHRLSSFCGGSGIPQVEAEIKGYINPQPFKLLIAKLLGGISTALAGMALGREGPSIQIGAMSGKFLAQQFQCNKTIERMLLTCGASAGLAAAFNAPVAGVIFAVEEVHRHVNRKLLVTVMSAAVTADVVSKFIFGLDTVFQFEFKQPIALQNYWQILCFGIFLALMGIVYRLLMQFLHQCNKRFKARFNLSAFAFLLPFFLLPLFFLYFHPLVLGGGHYMLAYLQSAKPLLLSLVGLFALKLFFAVFCFSSGVPGGIFYPILVLGATLGAIFALLFAPENFNSYLILGMAGYLTAIVRAPLTAVVLIFEMTGNITYLLPLTLVCLTSYALSNYLASEPIYEYLLSRLKKEQTLISDIQVDRVLLDFVVEAGSVAVNRKIKELVLPQHCLLVNVERDGISLIPKGETVLLSGDVLKFLTTEQDLHLYYNEISQLCSVVPLLAEDHQI